MGCWNETCGISNLPIHTGEKVCLFILGPTSNNGLAGEGYYADDLFVQLGFPIFGVYPKQSRKAPSFSYGDIRLNLLK